MLDPRTGEVLALASTPTYDACAIAEPGPGPARRRSRRSAGRPDKPLLDRAVQGRYVPGSVFKIVTSIAALGSGAITPDTTFARQPAGREERAARVRVPDPRRPPPLHRRPGAGLSRRRSRCRATSTSRWPAWRPAGTPWPRGPSGSASAAPIPFDLPTAASQVTNGGGSFGGGFSDDVELANAAYGQGETLVTPLQMALVAATVANDGDADAAAPRDPAVGPRRRRRTIEPRGLARRSVARTSPGPIGAAMVRAVEGDEGRRFTAGAEVPGVPTAGKSGTAQLDGSAKPHSWFIGSPRPTTRRSPSRCSSSRAGAARPGRRRSPAS